MDSRGFFSVDALFAVTLLLVVVGALTNLYGGSNQAATWASASGEAKLTCEKLAAAVNTVYTNGSSFELYIELPATIQNRAYTIFLDNSNREITIAVPDAGVTSSTAKAQVACKNFPSENFPSGALTPSNRVRVYWENNSVKVTNWP